MFCHLFEVEPKSFALSEVGKRLPAKVQSSLVSIVIATALPLSVIEGDPAACQLEVPSPSILKNFAVPVSPVDRIAVPSGVCAEASNCAFVTA